MTTHLLHPDHLQPGDVVGSWRIVDVLGRGGSARVFKVERDGLFYAMKTYLLPLSSFQEELSEEEYVAETTGTTGAGAGPATPPASWTPSRTWCAPWACCTSAAFTTGT